MPCPCGPICWPAGPWFMSGARPEIWGTCGINRHLTKSVPLIVAIHTLREPHVSQTVVCDTGRGRSDGSFLLPVTDADGDGGASTADRRSVGTSAPTSYIGGGGIHAWSLFDRLTRARAGGG